MSLCIALFHNNGIYVCADSRVSFDSNNTHFYVNDNCQKIKQFGDKVVFMAGDLSTVNTLLNLISKDDTVENITKKVKKQFALNRSRLKKTRPEDEGDNLGVYIFTIENGVSVFYQVYHTDKWIIDRQEITNQCFKTVGAYSKEAINYILDIFSKGNSDADKIIIDTYEHFADEMVGGNMYSYAIVPGSIRQCETVRIKDHKPLVMFNQQYATGTYHATLDGTLTANKANIIGNIDCSSLKIAGTNVLDELNKINGNYLSNNSVGANKLKVNELIVGDNIQMGPNAYISWNKVTSKPDVAVKSDIPSYITATKITSTTIESPRIIGGSIESNTTINVGTDATIGEKLIISPRNYAAGIQWGTSNPRPEIYIDPSGGGMFLYNPHGGIYANNKRIDVEGSSVAVFG